jgi:hypothetical protein
LRDEPPISALTGFLGFARSFSRFAFALALEILAVETQVRDVEPGDFALPRSAGEREQQDRAVALPPGAGPDRERGGGAGDPTCGNAYDNRTLSYVFKGQRMTAVAAPNALAVPEPPPALAALGYTRPALFVPDATVPWDRNARE